MSELVAAFGIDWRLLAIQGLNFGLLLLALWYFLYRPVLRMIEERQVRIAEGVQSAEAAGRRLSEAQTEASGVVAQASRDAEGLVAAAKVRADEKAAEVARAAQSRAEALLAEASARAEEAKRAALRESEKEIAKAAMLAAEKILAQSK